MLPRTFSLRLYTSSRGINVTPILLAYDHCTMVKIVFQIEKQVSSSQALSFLEKSLQFDVETTRE